VSNGQVVAFQPAVENYGSRSQTAADVRAQVNLMQDVMQEVMQKDTHYGVIPGTKQPSLYKAGAEKIMSTFRLAADPEVEDLGRDGEVHYRVKVRILSATGMFLGAGIGECSSSEDKYAWRASRVRRGVRRHARESPPHQVLEVAGQDRAEEAGPHQPGGRVQHRPQDGEEARPDRRRADGDGCLRPVYAGHRGFAGRIRRRARRSTASRASTPARRRRTARSAPPRSRKRCDVASLGVEAFRAMWAGWAKEKRALVH
jgi:hypothetical protein